MSNATKLITRVPARTEPFGGIGWTVYEFSDATEAAEWTRKHPQAEMPCWRRYTILETGELAILPGS